MKNKTFALLLLIATLFSLPNFAQVEVRYGGKLSIGGNFLGMPTSSQSTLYTANDDYALYVKFDNSNGWKCAVKTNLTGPDATSYEVVKNNNTTGSFYVHKDGWIFSDGVYLGSDINIKENRVRTVKALDKISAIPVYTYKYKTFTIEKGPDKGLESASDTNLHMGVIAQDVQKIAPYMVREVKNGKLAVDYMQLIPLALDGVNELNIELQKTKAELDLLKARYNKLEESLNTEQGNKSAKSVGLNFNLFQNAPNPFTEETKIEYELGSYYKIAFIYIFNLQGSMIASYPLTNNKGVVSVKGNDLNAGMYLYSLIVDGMEIDTKRMILTK